MQLIYDIPTIYVTFFIIILFILFILFMCSLIKNFT